MHACSLGIDHVTLGHPILFFARIASRSHLVASPSFLCFLPSLPSDRHLSSNSQDSPLLHQTIKRRSPKLASRLAIRTASRRSQPSLAGLSSGSPRRVGNIREHFCTFFLIPFCLRRFGLLVTLALTVEYLTTIQPFLPFLAPFPCSLLLIACRVHVYKPALLAPAKDMQDAHVHTIE